MLSRLLLLLTTLTLAAGLPLSVIAARGFAGSPFGRVLRPIPVVFIGFIALNVPTIVGIGTAGVYDLIVSTLAVGAAVAAAIF
ncbi:hypothetical protein [Haloparvum sedimenti]|uniref:hypothetical protein n=1 Tax=Haloparvum sedimenti TaxID=1678448 RepID=UPI00071E7F01|nr:hypothetical protein [Haloparvum sedimenti]